MQQAHKYHMLERFQCLMEGLSHQGSTLLKNIYTDLYITEGGRGDVNKEHEVRQIERASGRAATKDRTVKCSEIFKQLSEQLDQSEQVRQMSKQGKPIGVVLTKGVAGIGKTVSVQKFVLDWAEGTSNQDVDFIFPLPFRELNLMKEKTISLIDVIRHFFPDVRLSSAFTGSESRVMFIFDGLDESRLPLDFNCNPDCCDVTKSVPMDMLLTNLIKGKLLPFAHVWITTRPAAAKQIPPEYVIQVTEIRGFNDTQKEEYFRKKLSEESLAIKTIAHLKLSRSLYIMCHIPVFSWILATVVESTSDGSGSVKIPRTLTQMYTHFLIIQVRMKQSKYTESDKRDEEIISELGKLAFQQLGKGNLIFYEEDLRECGIDITEASVYSGVCTQIFREEAGLYQGKVFSFVHLSIQEFFAALYVFLGFISRERNVPGQHQTSQLSTLFRASTFHDLHKTALDLALQSENGHLDLFLRFLLGLSLESNQSLLRHLLPQTNSQTQSSVQTVQLVKQKTRQQSSSDRRINLFYCLNELNQHAVVEHIDGSSGTLSVEMLLPGQWKTGKFNFETSEEYLDMFDLRKYMKTPEVDQTDLLSPDDILQKLMPSDVFTSSTSAELWSCPLSKKSCSNLASALTSHSSPLTQLDLRISDLQDSEEKNEVFKEKNTVPKVMRIDKCYLPGKLKVWCYQFTRKQEKARLVLELRNSTDPFVKNNKAPVRTGHKWRVEEAVDQAISRVMLKEIVGRTQSGRAGLGWGEAPKFWKKITKTVLMAELTVPWEGGMEAAFERKKEKYTELVAECREAGWTANIFPVEMLQSCALHTAASSIQEHNCHLSGSYECLESGLRWSCAGPVTLQYRISKEEQFWSQLQMLGYRPVGPLLEIKLLSGELEEVHLPHSLCLGGSDPVLLRDKVKALHGDDSGVSLETCELSRFHGRLSAQQFSLWQLVVRLGVPVKIHCEVLIYEHNPWPLVLHVYMLPSPSSAKQALQEEYQERGAQSIIKPFPDHSLAIGSTFQLHSSSDSLEPPNLL
ncbi:protein NLRC3-like [Engraulis encrasicolus]|uniref:protein NLRC3-like n=1 Tax=Engraulis encrasicolus TaxID=184585 RepID=UPI002FD2ECAD